MQNGVYGIYKTLAKYRTYVRSETASIPRYVPSCLPITYGKPETLSVRASASRITLPPDPDRDAELKLAPLLALPAREAFDRTGRSERVEGEGVRGH